MVTLRLLDKAEEAVTVTRDGINTSLVVATAAIVIATIALIVAVSRNG